MGRRVLMWVLLFASLASYAGSYGIVRSQGLIRADCLATCSWRYQLLPPTSPGQSYGRRATQPEDNVYLIGHPLTWGWWPLTLLEARLFPARVAAELEVVEPPGTLCSAVVHVPPELGPGEARVGSHWLVLSAEGTSQVVFLDPSADTRVEWFGDARRTVTLTFQPEAGRHHELTLPLE